MGYIEETANKEETIEYTEEKTKNKKKKETGGTAYFSGENI